MFDSHLDIGWLSYGDSGWSFVAWPSAVTSDPEPWNSRLRCGQLPDVPPFTGGWVGFLEYELGYSWEPAASTRGKRGSPGARWFRCDDALLHHRATGRWWAVGDPPVDKIVRRLCDPDRIGPDRTFRCGPLRSQMGRDGYMRAVARAIEYIRAGDVYQVNLAHELTGRFEGSTRAAYAALRRAARPAMGAYFAWDENDRRRAVLSASPEMFLTLTPDGRVSTRPMKGTRPGRTPEHELRDAEKDRAELNMIIDLMRNDLGRVCRFGSVRVDEPRAIERHGGDDTGVLQATGTVSGVLRPDASLGDLLRATFPAGSVTGAPKIRAMQIIDELEDSPRGVYCGAIGVVSDCGHAQFSVAIRTAVVEGSVGDAERGAGSAAADGIADGRLSYRVGAGIVADSDPRAEWEETMVKAGAVKALAEIDER